MKTFYMTLFSAFILSQTSDAQLTLLATWHEPQTGTSEGYKSYDSMAVIPKSTGASQTWDFSGMSIKTSSSVTNYVAPAAVPSASLFPNATVVGDDGNNSYQYLNTTPAQVELLGTTDLAGTFSFSDTKILMKWPTAFNATYTDAYAGTGDDGIISGTITSEASGSGSVMLPGGATFTNCLQIHTYDKLNFTDTASAANNFSMTSRVYSYYSDLQRYPIVVIEYNALYDDTDTLSSAQVYINHLLAVGLNDFNFDATYAIYPNPAKDHFAVKLSNQGSLPCEVQLYNMTGQLVKKVDLGNSINIENNIDVSELGSGIYMVRTSLGDKTSTRKLVVE